VEVGAEAEDRPEAEDAVVVAVAVAAIAELDRHIHSSRTELIVALSAALVPTLVEGPTIEDYTGHKHQAPDVNQVVQRSRQPSKPSSLALVAHSRVVGLAAAVVADTKEPGRTDFCASLMTLR
jgi:hypothetical protein